MLLDEAFHSCRSRSSAFSPGHGLQLLMFHVQHWLGHVTLWCYSDQNKLNNENCLIKVSMYLSWCYQCFCPDIACCPLGIYLTVQSVTVHSNHHDWFLLTIACHISSLYVIVVIYDEINSKGSRTKYQQNISYPRFCLEVKFCIF